MSAFFVELGAAMIVASTMVPVVITGLGMLFQKQLHAMGQRLRLTDAEHFKAAQRPLTVAAGAILGVLVTVTSIGVGALGAVMLTYLYPVGVFLSSRLPQPLLRGVLSTTLLAVGVTLLWA